MADKYLISGGLVDKLRKIPKPTQKFGNDRYFSKGAHPRYFARITAKAASGTPASAVYEGEQMQTDASGYFQLVSGGMTWTASGDLGPLRDLQSCALYNDYQTTDFKRVPLGTIVEVFYFGDTDGNPRWYFVAPTFGELFAVNLTTDGGSAGSGVAQCSFTYEVFDLNSNSLATTKSPIYARPTYGKFVAATHGMAYWGESELKLYTTDEVPDVEACP